MDFQHIALHALHDAAERTDSPSETANTETTRATSRPRSRYIPALDGIRTLAVAAVVAYHLQTAWMPGGLQGVTVFFVLSGFLITRLLLVEFTATGRIDLKGFWLRRIRRLLPAIVTVMLACAALCTVFNHVMLTKMRPDIVPSLLFFNNWWQILRNVSYFDALGDPSPLTHFWSLAIEAQFYLVWPLILIVAFRLGAKRRCLRRFALVAAAASAVVMAVLYDPAADPSRVYYGTDTRVFSLLLGAWLAFIPERAMRPQAIIGRLSRRCARRARRSGVTETASMAAAEREHGTLASDLVGLAGLVGLVLIMVFSNGYTAFQYQGGTLLASVFTLMLIAACVQRDTLLARVFSAAPLVWLGKRSYSIYLWHYPLLLLMNPASDISAKPWWIYAVQVAIVVAVAALSYRFVEEPCRRGAIGSTLRSLREHTVTPRAFVRTHAVYLVTGTALIAAAGIGIAAVPDTSAISEEGAALLEEGGQTGSGNTATPSAPTESDEANGDFPAGSYDIVMIGDSVSVRTVPAFQDRFPHGYIDAMKNRQFSAGIDIYRDLIDKNLAGGILVFALGTNGPMSDRQIDELMNLAGDKRTVVFVNTRSPRPWVGPTNETLARAAERYDNVRVVDWYGFSEGKDELFEGDGTHLNDEGARAYIDLVYNAVRDVLPIHLDDEKTKQMIDDQLGAIQQALAGPVDELAESELAGRTLEVEEDA